MDLTKGWIKLYRSILDCEIWDKDEPFDVRSAWIDLLLLCNHKDREIIFNGKPLTVKRGQYLTSVRKLSARWSWGKDKVLNYLKLLETLKMIKRNADSNRTVITIVKYEVFQDNFNMDTDSDKDTNKDSQQTVSRQSADSDPPQTRSKECKNVNNIDTTNNIYHSLMGQPVGSIRFKKG